MPLKIYRRKGSLVWSYRGTLAGRRLRGSTGTPNKERAAQIASEVENKFYKRRLDGPQEILTFPQAAALYLKAQKSDRFIAPLLKYWGDAKVKDMHKGAIKQSAIEIYPSATGATRNRQVITPTQAIINHAAELGHCPPIRVKRFQVEEKIKKPILLDWLDTFCAYADADDVKALAIFMFATGSRIGDAMRLQWSDIDFKARTILIRKTKTKKERLPHMPPRLLVALANLPRDKKPFHRPQTTLRDGWDRAIEAAAKAAGEDGFERLTFHSCRHGFATTMLRKRVDVKTTMKLGGWESVQLFMKTYAHAIDDPTLSNRVFDTEETSMKAEEK